MKNNNLAGPAPTVEHRLPHRDDLCVFPGGWTCYRHELGTPQFDQLTGDPRVIHYHTREWWLVQDQLGKHPSLASRFELEPVPMPYEVRNTSPAPTFTKPYRKPRWSLKVSTALTAMVYIAVISWAGVQIYEFLRTVQP